MRLKKRRVSSWEAVPSNDHHEPELPLPYLSQSREELIEPSEWPSVPTQLVRIKPSSLFTDLLCALIIVPFVVLLYACYNANGKTGSPGYYDAMHQGLSISATAYPLIFSVFVGRLLKRITAYRLERGSSLRTLELLNGSSTLVNTVRTYTTLRSSHILGLTLTLLWLVSPLGGQSALHVVRQDATTSTSTREVKYFDTTSSGNERYSGAGSSSIYSPGVDGIYTTSILAPKMVKQSSMDVWGNVKTPSIQALAGSPNATGWVTVPDNDTQIEYSSLAGIPIMGLPKNEGNITFNLRSTYFDLSFDLASTMTVPFVLNGSGISVNYAQSAGFIGTPVDDWPAIDTFWILSNMGYGPLYFNIQQVYVESTINCSNGVFSKHSCRVTAMRNITTSPPVAYNRTQWVGVTMNNVLALFNHTTSITNALPEAYLRDPDAPLTVDLSQTFNISTIESKRLLFSRLAQLFNTYAFAVADPTAILKGNSSYIITTPAHFVYLEPLPRTMVSWVWLSIFTAAIFVLGLAVVATIILNVMTLNPDVLGFVSTATWRSPYIEVPEKGSFLDGEQRTRLLKDVVIRLGDVQSWDSSAGKLGIGTVDRTVEVTTTRKYR